MFITTAHWENVPSMELITEFEIKASELYGDFDSTKLLDWTVDGGVNITRTWPDQVTADAWCTYIVQLGATSAVVTEE